MKVIISDDDGTILQCVSIYLDTDEVSEVSAAADIIGLISLRYEVEEDDE